MYRIRITVTACLLADRFVFIRLYRPRSEGQYAHKGLFCWRRSSADYYCAVVGEDVTGSNHQLLDSRTFSCRLLRTCCKQPRHFYLGTPRSVGLSIYRLWDCVVKTGGLSKSRLYEKLSIANTFL